MKYIAAAVQMHAGLEKQANVDRAIALVEQAAEQGAQLVVLPEFFNCLGHLSAVVEQAEPVPGPTSRAMAGLAARLKITLLAGSICQRQSATSDCYNTSLLFDPAGQTVAQYRKVHLFDCDLPGKVTFMESQWIAAGEDVAASETPLGCIGQATCYDVRFPELFRKLADRGVQVLAFPSAFADTTGQAHWEVLLRARAIENQCYIVAANQYGQHTTNFTTHGHSMIVDPWGTVLASADAGDAVVTAEIDLEHLHQIRRNLPALTHRRW